MRLEDSFAVVPLGLPGEFEQFRRHLDGGWLEDALLATGTATIRRRRIPAEQALWLVIGMALMRNESIERVAALLNVALPALGADALVARSALTQARQRLGQDPLRHLFSATADEWSRQSAAAHLWKGLSLYAMDGTTMRVPV